MPFEDRLSRIRETIATRSTYVAAEVVLAPPWSLERIEAFEARYEFRFPEGYREFLATVASGGSCLSFEMVAPGDPRGYMEDNDRKLWAKLLDNVGRPFPFTKSWEFSTRTEFDSVADKFYHGNILLGGDLCGMDWRLIVTGEARGQVWMRGGDYFEQAGGGWDFLIWFEKFLEGPEDYWGW